MLLLLTAPRMWAQTITWSGAQELLDRNKGSITITATTADAKGNIYLTGNFLGTVTLGNSILTTSSGNYEQDVFVAKWNKATTRFEWAVQSGILYEHDEARAIAVSGTSIYVTGVGIGSFRTSSVTRGVGEVFVAKLLDRGSTAQFVWNHQVSGLRGSSPYARSDYPTALAVSGTNVYVAGAFRSDIAHFGTVALTNINTRGFYDSFVAKLTDEGATSHFDWAKRARQRSGEWADDEITALAANGTSVYVVGTQGGNSAHSYFAKLTDAGVTARFVWRRESEYQYGAAKAQAIAVSGTSVYVAGTDRGNYFVFGFPKLVNTDGSTVNAFVLKCIDMGDQSKSEWALPVSGTSGNIQVQGLAVSGSDVYLAGSFWDTVSFGSNRLTTLPPGYFISRNEDIFVAKVTESGAIGRFAWALQAGGNYEDQIAGLVLSGQDVFVAGFAAATSYFGPFVINGSAPGSALAYNRLSIVAYITDSAMQSPMVLPTSQAARQWGVELYPNPASGQATVVMPIIQNSSSATLTLRDAVGRVLRSYFVPPSIGERRHILDLAGLPVGLYALHVQVGSKQIVRWLTIH
ncbi:hypothetical protein BXP70_28075 [Hymenobacter crusticola]|uniref:Secretion system C-terminal sorting domain-containing protein n=2 Tax=Hymenobacter crusticola TaxID=1770526 RepID=A0A2C9ZTS8_9BACT|nr:hypothetical protein BXP70_28075 [Hymenobacter crusticola]